MDLHRRASARSQYEHRRESRDVVEPQRNIEWGTPWMTWMPGSDGYTRKAHVRWGRVLTYQETLLGRLYAGETPGELREHAQTIVRRYDRGWRLSYSVCACTPHTPELASLHRTDLWPVSWVEWGYAEEAGFDPRRYHRSPWYRTMLRRVKSEQATALWSEGLEE